MDTTTSQRAPRSGWNMRRVRQWHNYIGVFFAPAILFFVISGAFQTLGLHETRDGGPYEPPRWIVTMASIHKDQTLPRARAAHAEPVDHDHDHAAPEAHGESHAKPEPGPSPWPLKIFVLCLALGLGTSALLGVTIALKNTATRQTSLILLAAGALLPIVLLFL